MVSIQLQNALKGLPEKQKSFIVDSDDRTMEDNTWLPSSPRSLKSNLKPVTVNAYTPSQKALSSPTDSARVAPAACSRRRASPAKDWLTPMQHPPPSQQRCLLKPSMLVHRLRQVDPPSLPRDDRVAIKIYPGKVMKTLTTSDE